MGRSPSPAHPALIEIANGVLPLTEAFSWCILPRHGKRPIGIQGRALLHAASPGDHAGYKSEATIFELQGGGFAACIRHARASDGAVSWQNTLMGETAAELSAQLRDHAPVCLTLSQTGGAASLAGSWHDLRAALCGDAA